ncbi:MAG: glycosyltransferase family 4 protein [Actinomycetota bacterium]
MKIGFLLRNPTQFDTPFFRYVRTRLRGELKVIYTRGDQLADRVFDAELGREISWGMDLLEGYPYSVLPSRKRASWLLHELRGGCYDLLVVNGYSEPALIAATFAAKLTSVPVALRLDTPSFRRERPAKRAIRRLFYTTFRRVFDHFLPVGSSSAEFLEGMGVAREQMSLFPYTVDLDHFRRGSTISAPSRRDLRRKYGLPEAGPVVVAVTKFHPRESPWDLLRAYCAMDSPGACLWLVGDGPERAALEEYARRRCPSGVVFGGYVPYPELPAMYGVADAFVHPARYEPWGVSVQEALASGLPVLASSMVGAARDFVTAGKNGLIYRAGNSEELGLKFPELLSLISSAEARKTTEENLAKCEYLRIWTTLTDVARGCSAHDHTTLSRT